MREEKGEHSILSNVSDDGWTGGAQRRDPGAYKSTLNGFNDK
jgi:hypothetical protein